MYREGFTETVKTSLPTITPLPVGTPAPDVSLQTSDGSAIGLAQFWQRAPVLLFFVRHVGCVFCRDQLRLLAGHYADFRARGAELVAITPVDAINSARFARGMHLPFPMLADLPRRSFAAFGLYSVSAGEILQPEVLLRTAQQWTHGNVARINPFSPSFTQIGGVFIVNQSGQIELSHAASPVYSYPSVNDHLAVFDAIAGVAD